MEQVQVKITAMVMTNRYGTLSNGDVLRTDAEFAKHLVDECGAAEYLPATVLPVEKTPAKKFAKSKAAPQDQAPVVEPTPPVAESAEETTAELAALPESPAK